MSGVDETNFERRMEAVPDGMPRVSKVFHEIREYRNVASRYALARVATPRQVPRRRGLIMRLVQPQELQRQQPRRRRLNHPLEREEPRENSCYSVYRVTFPDPPAKSVFLVFPSDDFAFTLRGCFGNRGGSFSLVGVGRVYFPRRGIFFFFLPAPFLPFFLHFSSFCSRFIRLKRQTRDLRDRQRDFVGRERVAIFETPAFSLSIL